MLGARGAGRGGAGGDDGRSHEQTHAYTRTRTHTHTHTTTHTHTHTRGGGKWRREEGPEEGKKDLEKGGRRREGGGRADRHDMRRQLQHLYYIAVYSACLSRSGYRLKA